MCFIRMFPARSFVSINDVNRLVSSISSALNYLVRKLQIFVQLLMLPNIFQLEYLSHHPSLKLKICMVCHNRLNENKCEM